jgi:hypothetical protein
MVRIELIVPGGFDRGGRKEVIPAFLHLTELPAWRHSIGPHDLGRP